MSPTAKPVTVSPKVNVAVNTALLFDGTPPIVSVGAVASHFAVAETSAAGPVLPEPSLAAPAATVIFTSSVPPGDTTSA